MTADSARPFRRLYEIGNHPQKAFLRLACYDVTPQFHSSESRFDSPAFTAPDAGRSLVYPLMNVR